jgi:hypothetical protein
MFPYSDPTTSGLLERHGALLPYRITLHGLYRNFAASPSSAFTMLEAFQGLHAVESVTVTWPAFPKMVNASFEEIDERRLTLQEEYVEWTVDRDGRGRVTRITFTTLFPEYFEALAESGMDALVTGIRDLYPDADPTAADLFGTGFDPSAASPTARARQLRSHSARNPWNNGEKGILYLTQGANTLPALINLLAHCGVERSGITAGAVCAVASGACVPGRNSDPKVCEAVQNLARSRRAFSLADPAGIRILSLGGIWKRDGEEIDINDTTSNGNVWRITHGGRRAVLEVPETLTLIDDPVRSGTEVSILVEVGATVVFAPEGSIPAWARTGSESTRALPD